VDCDIGQSSLGLPGTVSMKIFTNGSDYEAYRFERMSFLGTTNPAMVIPMMIKASARMVGFARQAAKITHVDTTGLVSGKLGETLKAGKIKEIMPDHVIAICREQELEQVLV